MAKAGTAEIPIPPRSCEFCDVEITFSHEREWQHSPNGRPYCPECGRIPSDHQRDEEVFPDV